MGVHVGVSGRRPVCSSCVTTGPKPQSPPMCGDVVPPAGHHTLVSASQGQLALFRLQWRPHHRSRQCGEGLGD